MERVDVPLSVGETLTVNVQLRPAGVAETTTVTADAVIETTRTLPAVTIGELAIDTVPINGRRFQDFMLLTPGAVIEGQRSGTSVNGQRGSEAYTISQEAIKEFSVNNAGPVDGVAHHDEWPRGVSADVLADVGRRAGVPEHPQRGADRRLDSPVRCELPGDGTFDQDRRYVNGVDTGRNAFRHPNFFRTDVRVSKMLRLSGRSAEIAIDVFNLFDNTNGFVGSSNRNFLNNQAAGVPNEQIGGSRQGQISLRVQS